MKRYLAAGLMPTIFVVVATPWPVVAQSREHQQMVADIRMLQEQTQQLQLLLGSLAEQLKVVTAKMDQQADHTRKAFADQKLLVDNLTESVRIVREKLDDTNVRLSGLSQELEALRTSIPVAPMVPTDPNAAAEPGVPVEPGAEPSAAAISPGVPPQRLYDQAYADYLGGQWDLAIQGFETYIKTFPRSDLADDAQFYIGQTYYADGRFKEAVQAYDRLIADYSTSDWLPDGYYKRGVALDRLGETARARESFEHVLKNHPETPAAILAKQALDRSNRPPH